MQFKIKIILKMYLFFGRHLTTPALGTTALRGTRTKLLSGLTELP